MWKDPETGELKNGIAKVGYRHEECVQILVQRPFITQRELAGIFGVSESWLSSVMSSDAFKARLAEAKLEVHGPIIASVKEKLEHLAHASLDRLLSKIEGPAAMPKDETLIAAATLSTKALGYGARAPGDSERGAQVIINLPSKAPNESAWATRYTPGGSVEVIENGAGTPAPR